MKHIKPEKLITPEFEKLFETYPLGSQDHLNDPLLITEIMNCNADLYYLCGYDPKDKVAQMVVVTGDKRLYREVYCWSVIFLEREGAWRNRDFIPIRLSRLPDLFLMTLKVKFYQHSVPKVSHKHHRQS